MIDLHSANLNMVEAAVDYLDKVSAQAMGLAAIIRKKHPGQYQMTDAEVLSRILDKWKNDIYNIIDGPYFDDLRPAELAEMICNMAPGFSTLIWSPIRIMCLPRQIGEMIQATGNDVKAVLEDSIRKNVRPFSKWRRL